MSCQLHRVTTSGLGGGVGGGGEERGEAREIFSVLLAAQDYLTRREGGRGKAGRRERF